MKNLTSNQIGLIRNLLEQQTASNITDSRIHRQEHQEILDLLELGCGVTIRSCEEEDKRLIDQCTFPGCEEHSGEEEYCKQCLRVLRKERRAPEEELTEAVNP
jgi:hypothetical protein